MPYLQVDGQQHELASGTTVIGSSPDAGIVVAGAGECRAVVRVAADGSAIVARDGNAAAAAAGTILVNGVTLGAEPAPLLHGDKITIGGRELTFGDDAAAGQTRVMRAVESRSDPPVLTLPSAARASGGRLISLVDGREYPVPAEGLVIGRDPSCTVVLRSQAVSRRHAVIAAARDAYMITDTSANGLTVNGEPVVGSESLARGDVIRIGDENFRFYADTAPPDRPALATIDLLSAAVGIPSRAEIHTALVYVGRGDHNDIVLADESVSETHATLQKREDGWYVVDLDSTNGTYVGGRRIQGAQRLEGAPDIRFGGLKFIFRPVEDASRTPAARAAAGGTRVIAARPGARAAARAGAISEPPTAEVPRAPRLAPGVPAIAAPPPREGGIPLALWVAVLVIVGAVVFFIVTGR
ncbi:MAG TPA: FHA domain-containing protein [Gemmatimonadaceae bacterium]|nr:FHA domain-containing protein [Gemmatimonadaceae bacterium]